MLSKVFKQNYHSFKIKIKVKLKDKNTKKLLSSNLPLHDEWISLTSFNTNCRTELFESFLTSLCHWWSNCRLEQRSLVHHHGGFFSRLFKTVTGSLLNCCSHHGLRSHHAPFLDSSQRNRHHSDVHKLFVDNIIMDKRRIGLASFIFFVALFLLVETLASGELK